MPPSVDDFIAQMQQSREKVPETLTSKINEIARKAIHEMSKEAGKFLHEDLDDDKHTEEQVKAIISLFPESLSQVNKDRNLPIQSALYVVEGRSSVTFVPLMAREGCRLGVGGEEIIGGLLSVMPNDNYGENTLQWLSGIWIAGPVSIEYDRKLAQVLEKLRDLNLLKKADIEEYCLFNEALDLDCQRRFDFFTSWDPAALGARDSEWIVPIHRAVPSFERDIKVKEKRFEMALKAGMKYYPERLGFLFCKEKGITACKQAFNEIGVDTAMKIIRKCIPPSDNHTILHHTIRHAPDLENDIGQYYPDATFLRDTNGHTISQLDFYINLRKG